MPKFAPSLMCANLMHLSKDIEALDRCGVDLFHLDIMDGHFVPNMALSLDHARQIRQLTETPIDVHLMVKNPEDYLSALSGSRVDWVSFHIETVHTPIRLLHRLRSLNMKVGVALNPTTSLSHVEYLLGHIDYIVLMTVEPGFAGQKFLPEVLEKLSLLNQMREESGLRFAIEVDGNIDENTAKSCLQRGADILVLGTSSIFIKGKNLDESMQEFKEKLGV